MNKQTFFAASVLLSLQLTATALPLQGAKTTDPLAATADESAPAQKTPAKAAPSPAPAASSPTPVATPATPKVEKDDGKKEEMILSERTSSSKLGTGKPTTTLGSASPASAPVADAPPPQGIKVVPAYNTARFGQLDALRSQNAILQEQVKAQELRNKLAGTPAAGVPGGPGGAMAGGKAAPSEPVVVRVDGIDGVMSATVLLPSGQTARVRVGSTVAGLGTVKSISLNEVCVASKSNAQCLPFSGTSAQY